MKKTKLFALLMLLIVGSYAQSPKKYVMYTDSAGNNHIDSRALPQIAISGYFVNLLNLPTTVAGYGITDAVTTSVLTGYYNTSANTSAKTASYTILSTDFASGHIPVLYITFDCTSGNLTCTLPTATSFAGYTIYVSKIDASTNTLTLSGLTGDNIIGTKGWVKIVISAGGNWTQN